ncbi:MAG: hypothetical protein HOY79_04260 [Streptomyces sp.]|nr:hypothetical protein [Streptomyces sp.]NUS15419.1 hypothetical protein [Streptomyces sp.]NUS24123.1 hypothetical protein [Streptomyces sp.]
MTASDVPDLSDEQLLLKGIAARHKPPLTLEQASERMARGGDVYRKLLQRGHEAFREALSKHGDTIADRDGAASWRDMMAALDQHQVDYVAIRLTIDYWSDNYNRASNEAWEVPDGGSNLLFQAHYVRMAVYEYAWPGNQDEILRMHPAPQRDANDGGF